MSQDRNTGVVHKMAGELLEAVTSGDKVSNELIEAAENIIQTHQLYVQLLYVGMVVGRITQLQHYFDALDSIIEIVDTEDLAESDTNTKLRAAAVYNQSIKTKIEVINTMMSSRDAIGLLISSLKTTFGTGEEIPLDDDAPTKDLMSKLRNMAPAKRQEILGGIVSMLRKAMKEEDDTNDR